MCPDFLGGGRKRKGKALYQCYQRIFNSNGVCRAFWLHITNGTETQQNYSIIWRSVRQHLIANI